MRAMLASLLFLFVGGASADLLPPMPTDMRPVVWVDDDGNFWFQDFMTGAVEMCSHDCSQRMARNWERCRD